MVIFSPETVSPRVCGAKVTLLQNSVGQRTKGPKLCCVNFPSNFALQSYGAFVLCPAFFAPSFEPLVLCPAEFWSNATYAPHTHKDIVSGAKTTLILLEGTFKIMNVACRISRVFHQVARPHCTLL